MKIAKLNLFFLLFINIPIFANATKFDCDGGGGDNIEHCIPLINFTNQPIYTSVTEQNCTDGSYHGFDNKIIPAANTQGPGNYSWILGANTIDGCASYSDMEINYYTKSIMTFDSYIGTVHYHLSYNEDLDEYVTNTGPYAASIYIRTDSDDYLTSFTPYSSF